ncbi:hypothetical protein L9F63_008925, partial [Diploptera punctata]
MTSADSNELRDPGIYGLGIDLEKIITVEEWPEEKLNNFMYTRLPGPESSRNCYFKTLFQQIPQSTREENMREEESKTEYKTSQYSHVLLVKELRGEP